ncbi:helix-turn-helix domain-containing protein [Flavobacteriaceae bacterium AU392]|nr:AraC family transcriptional regulator [Flavobacteriaceae bacterium]RKM85615.1 helix-turn-helix domain-containing protein [Flavobacteriaceae bacterium AU392]
MDYEKELSFVNEIDCYWESTETGNYPTLPEPYINLFFPIKLPLEAKIKGITSNYDYLKIESKLFGVRLYLRGFYYLKLTQCFEISDKIVDLKQIGTGAELLLSKQISNAKTFEERVVIFKTYYNKKRKKFLTKKELNISIALQYLRESYKDENIIKNYARIVALSPRTINRWFVKDIGINPKKISRIVRFHNALSCLHSYNTKGFYFDFGYYDQAHFIKEFKEFTGKSPESYLKRVSDLYKT